MPIEERLKLLKEGAKTAFGRALAEFLDEERAKLNSVKGHKEKEDYWAQEKAVELIDRLFSFMERDNPQSVKGKQDYT